MSDGKRAAMQRFPRKQLVPDYSQWQVATSSLHGEELFAKYQAEWLKSDTPPIMWDDLERLIHNGSRSSRNLYVAHQIAAYAQKLQTVRCALMPYRSRLKQMLELDHADVYLPLLMALEPGSHFGPLYDEFVLPLTPSNRAYVLGELAENFNGLHGREQTRREISDLWQTRSLIEEEKETLVEGCLKQHLFDWQTLPSLGQQAQEIAIRLLRRDDLSLTDFGLYLDETLLETPTPSSPADALKLQVRLLSQQVTIPTRLVGSGLTREELARLQLKWLHPVLSAAAFHRRRPFRHPIFEEFRMMFGPDWPRFFYSEMLAPSTAGLRPLSVPLIRLLHLRMLLDAPSLSASIARPETSMVPEIMLFMLQNDGVTYFPELSLPSQAEKGWRRRWAESNGEAIATLFMEDALALDLTTLERIQESTIEQTPDFKAMTFSGERIVFESKGSSSWKSFRKSKRKALDQLAKTGTTPAWRQTLASSNNNGRCFACCLFVTTGDEADPTQFHVEDPPFAFDRLFPSEWEYSARRRHYAAVLEAAQMFTEAAIVRENREWNPNIREYESSSWELSDGTPIKCVGRQQDVLEFARRLGHPEPDIFRSLKLFTGIETQVFDRLRQRELPAARPYGLDPFDRSAIGRSQEASNIPPFGFLPARTNKGKPGVFSRLSNGSFLAIELQD